MSELKISSSELSAMSVVMMLSRSAGSCENRLCEEAVSICRLRFRMTRLLTLSSSMIGTTNSRLNL